MAKMSRKEEYCDWCFAVKSSVKACSHCHVAFYCSKECQKESYAKHKPKCREVYKREKSMKFLERELRNNEYENFWRDCIGHFWGCLDPRDYCRERHCLAETLVELGIQDDNERAFEAALGHYLELMRLSQKDNQGIRSHVPFVLLILDRQVDCYGFIKWWATIDPDGTYDWGKVRKYKEGAWAYLRNQNVEEDLFDDKRVKSTEYFSGFHLTALILLKILLIKDMEKYLNSARTAFLLGTTEVYGENSPLLKLANKHPILDKIFLYMKINSGLSLQERLFDKYCTIMDSNNPIVLKALVNPKPLLAQDEPMAFSIGSPSEAYFIIKSGHYAFLKLKAVGKLREKYGREPKYKCKIAHLRF